MELTRKHLNDEAKQTIKFMLKGKEESVDGIFNTSNLI